MSSEHLPEEAHTATTLDSVSAEEPRLVRETPPVTVSGTVRVDARTRKLAARIESGDIAVIDVKDLDRDTAQAFVSAGVSAVLNAAPSITGRYPNLGPLVLLEAGITLIDDLGADIMTLKEGATVRLDGDAVTVKGSVVATGRRQTVASVREATERAREGFSAQIQAFAATTGEYLERESRLVMSGTVLPELATDLDGRVVLVVLDDADVRDQLKGARAWLRDTYPFVVAVDGGAHVAAQMRLRPDVIVGDMEIVPEKLLRSRAELVVGLSERYRSGADRLKRMGLEYHAVDTTVSAADIAILLASYAGASAIVVAGEHATFEDFLDRGRTGMAASFFTRLRAGGQMIPLSAVAATYQPRMRAGLFVLLVVSALLALGTAFLTTPLGNDIYHQITRTVSDTQSVSAPSEAN